MRNIYAVKHMEEFVSLNWDPSDYVLTISATLALYNIKPNNHGLNVITSIPLFRQVANDPRFEQIVAKESGDISFRLGNANVYVYGRIFPHTINTDELIGLGEIHSNINFINLELIRDRGLGMEKEIQRYINKVRIGEAKEKYQNTLHKLSR